MGAPWGRASAPTVALFVLASSVALAAAFPGVLRIPRREPGAAPTPPTALFSHRVHGSFGCYGCHPSVFPQAPVAFTHEDMRQGRFCGHCHDDRTAFAIQGAACGRCHVDAH
jgi:c(7)-type cytochrome triheme protein